MAKELGTLTEVVVKDAYGSLLGSFPAKLNINCNGSSFLDEMKQSFRGIAKTSIRDLPKRYIIYENSCIFYFKDGIKTFSKRKEHDEFDKEIGFLFCCYQHYYNHLSRNKREKIISWINYEHIKKFLMEIFIERNKFTEREAKVYLRDLKVERKAKKASEVTEIYREMQKITKEEIKEPEHMKEVTE